MLIVSGQAGDAAHQLEGHPERPDRTTAAFTGIADLHLDGDLKLVPARLATREQLELVHDPRYLDELVAFCEGGGGDLDPDTYATAESWSIARYSAGAGLAAVEALAQADDGVAFVVTRPPGHHALADRALGFCLLNNVAVAAASLTAQGERVLIVDWDVHHGNGTQAIFWDDPNVLYVSTHQSPLFPGTGTAREVGGFGALNRIVNIPLPAGSTGDLVRRALDEVAAPVIDEFRPTWVLVSAGFDAHRFDPMAELSLSNGDFAELARKVAGYAPRPGRLALFLEGGYNLNALRTSVAATIGALLDCEYEPEDSTWGAPGAELISRARATRNLALEHAYESAVLEENL